jgi:hypothetical protein
MTVEIVASKHKPVVEGLQFDAFKIESRGGIVSATCFAVSACK